MADEKQTQEPTPKGAVELDESQIEQVQGGAIDTHIKLSRGVAFKDAAYMKLKFPPP